MFTIYLTNSDGEALALTNDIDAPQLAHFDSIRTMLDYVRQSLGTIGYRINDNFEAEAHIVTGYDVQEDGWNITDQVTATLANPFKKRNK